MTALQVGAFGKLPLASDFVRLNAPAREVRALDGWLQEGLELARQSLGARWDAAYDGAPPLRFVLRPRDCEDFLLGVAAPSRDAAGRRYPFSVFRLVAGREATEAWQHLPLACAGFLDGAESLLRSVRGGEAGAGDGGGGGALGAAGDGGAGRESRRRRLSEGVEALGAAGPESPVAVGDRYGAFLRRVTPKALLHALAGGSSLEGAAPSAPPGGSMEGAAPSALSGESEPFAASCGRLRGLRDVLRAVASAPARPGFALRVNLPALAPEVGADDPALLVAFWMDLVARSMGGRGRPDLVLWTLGAEGRAGRLFLAPPSPRLVASWLDPDRDSDRLWDLVPQIVPDAALGSAGRGERCDDDDDEDRDGCRQLLEDPGATLEDLLARVRTWTRS